MPAPTALKFAAVLSVIAAVFIPFAVFAFDPADAEPQHHTKHYEQSIFKMTDKGRYSVEVMVKDKSLKVGVNSFEIILHDKDDKDVVGAEVEVVPWMPEMGHGVFEKPVVKERGGGVYSVENVVLIMEGRWELRLNIRKSGTEDNVTFDFPDVKSSASMHFLLPK